ncbi:hypothetical protein CRV02_00190 [Arcobacter sp. CECT 8989]|uniref:hypothetical protein n=1 Tax=Arcobacter sp. CECT 8989 TaxID=2044509 RepID=UPI00100B22E2|nr:hypothetical protein [Arcobacter sp. CECT 8989]RXK03651.1 hypothetical protein CRV02_00190 [Arcobacter sp. CECT 8989]
MDTYFEILQEKAKKIGANIEDCGYDKDCIKDVLALKVKNDLENESLETIKEKANDIEADTLNYNTKEEFLDAIEEKVKKVLEEENELFTSIELQKNFMPIDLG